MKMLKKILHLPSSTCNSFLLLELGVLPILGEIHKRQLNYLHRVLTLPEDDPVHQIFENMLEFEREGERNWWSDVKPVLALYGLPEDLSVVGNLSKESFKRMVKNGVHFKMAEKLKNECSNLQKTADLTYDEMLQTQQYLKEMYPEQARLILQARSRTLDIKTNNAFKFQEDDMLCRKCGQEIEELEHIVNCGHAEKISLHINLEEDSTELLITELRRTANRIQQFYGDVEGSAEMNIGE